MSDVTGEQPITLALTWDAFSIEGKPHYDSWNLKAANFLIGSVYFSPAGWNWQLDQYDVDEFQGGFTTREDAQAALIQRVRKFAV
jgi:hypothetical protein